MPHCYLEDTFANLETPVVVCREEAPYPILYANRSATLLLNPLFVGSVGGPQCTAQPLYNLLAFAAPGTDANLFAALLAVGRIHRYHTRVLTREKETIQVSISASHVQNGGHTYCVLYIYPEQQEDGMTAVASATVLNTVFGLALHSKNTEETIREILQFVGSYTTASRCYIYEDISTDYLQNSYEWCAEEVEPLLANQQKVSKNIYRYARIAREGLMVVHDVRTMHESDRRVLDGQGVKSIMVAAIVRHHNAIGYIGLDNCEQYHNWNDVEINLLQNVSRILASLLYRRYVEKSAQDSLTVLRTILDNIDTAIYVNDVHTHELVFLNRVMTRELGVAMEEVLGKPCWQILQKDKDGPCEFCPVRKMMDDKYRVVHGSYSWEFQNTMNQKWYMMHDSVIKWIDGRLVHIENATEITIRKTQEQQLQHFASVDRMTGVYNREWGYKKMCEMLAVSRRQNTPLSLVFIDINKLKGVNDTYGHTTGDAMIVQTVNMLREVKRSGDVLCRWGGDEFLLLAKCTPARAAEMMRRAEKAMGRVNGMKINPYILSVSYGITPMHPGPDLGVDSIITLADKEMYMDKMRRRALAGDASLPVR